MATLYRASKTKMIGVSNITASQLALLCQEAQVKPMMVQNRCFAVRAWDKEVRNICREHGIIYQGFSLLTANRDVLVEPEVSPLQRGRWTGAGDIPLCHAACCRFWHDQATAHVGRSRRGPSRFQPMKFSAWKRLR
jgi:hypothetical protein